MAKTLQKKQKITHIHPFTKSRPLDMVYGQFHQREFFSNANAELSFEKEISSEKTDLKCGEQIKCVKETKEIYES